MKTILICGGGNGAHVLIAKTSINPSKEVRVLSLHSNEADLWSKALAKQPLSCNYTEDDGREVEIKSRPDLVSNDPAQVVPGADVILITVPAFAHQAYLSAIEPHITSPALLVGLPGQPGFEFQSCFILKKKLPLITILSTESFPWACRIEEYGRRVRIVGAKKALKVANISGGPKDVLNPIGTLQSIIGQGIPLTTANHCLDLSLMFAVVHPGLMYGKWKNWNGQPIKEIPLFYQGAEEDQTICVEDLDEEIHTTAKTLSSLLPNINLGDYKATLPWLIDMYDDSITDQSSLRKALVTNKAYKGLLHPMKPVKDGFVPDFGYRYLSEEIPYGLVVVKGLAVLAAVNTPSIDKVIQWAQEKLGKEYIVGSELKGGNLHETRAPQVYGITSLDELQHFIFDTLAH